MKLTEEEKKELISKLREFGFEEIEPIKGRRRFKRNEFVIWESLCIKGCSLGSHVLTITTENIDAVIYIYKDSISIV